MKVKIASRRLLLCLTFLLLSTITSACGDVTTTPTAIPTPEPTVTPPPATATIAPTPTLTPPPLPSSFQPTTPNDYFVKPHFGHVSYVEAVALSPDRKYLATGGTDKLVKVWDANNGKLLTTLRGHLDSLQQIVFSPNSRLLAIISKNINGRGGAPDFSIHLWEIVGSKEVAILREHKVGIFSVRFLTDDLLVCRDLNSDGSKVTFILWNIKTQQITRQLGNTNNVYAISTDGKLLARREHSDKPQPKTEIVVTELATDKVITRLPFGDPYNYLMDLVFTPDTTKLAGVFGAHYNNDATFQVWDIASGTLISEEEQKSSGMLRDLVVSPDSKMVLASGSYLTNRPTIEYRTGVPMNLLQQVMASHQTAPVEALVKHYDLATGKVLNTWRTPEDRAVFAYFGADGKTPFAITQRYGNFYLRDLAANKIVTTFERAQPVTALAYSPDGKWLASGQDDGKIYLRNVSDGRSVVTLEGHTDKIMSLAFSPDSKRLASGSRDLTAKLWEISATGDKSRELATLKTHEAWITSVAFSPDGSKLATGSTDTNLKIWQLSPVNAKHQAEPTEIASSKAHGLGVWSVAFSPDGKSVFSAGRPFYDVKEALVRQWDATTGQPGTLQLTLYDFKEVRQIALSPDGKKLAAQDSLGGLKIFEVSSGKQLYTLSQIVQPDSGDYPESAIALSFLAFSNSGKALFSADAYPDWATTNPVVQVKVWEIGEQSGRELLTFPAGGRNVTSMTVNPQTQAIVVGYEDNALKVWSAQAQAQQSNPAVPTVTPQGQKAVPSPLPVTTSIANNAPVTKVNLKEIYNSPPFAGHTEYITRLFYLPDGKSLISSDDLSVKLWETSTGKELRAWFAYRGIIAVSPDGKMLATSAPRNEIKLWEIATGKEIRTLKGHGDPVFALAFSPDSKTLVSASTRYQSNQDKSIRIWQVSDGKQLVRIPTNSVSHIVFHPDGKSFAAATYTDGVNYDVNVYNLSGQLIAEPGKRISQLQTLSYSPDGQTLFVNDYLGWVRRWNVTAGYQSLKEYHLKMYVGKGVYTSDSKRIVTGDTSGTKERKIRIYAADGSGEQKSFPTFADGINALALSPDERFVAVGSEMPGAPERREIHIYELATGKEVNVFKGSWGISPALWVAPDGSSYYARTADDQITLYETGIGKALATVKIPDLDKWKLPVVTPDGKTLVVVNSTDKGLRLYDLPSGKQVGNFFGLSYADRPAIRPDGRVLAIAETNRSGVQIRLLDLRPGTQSGDSNTNLMEYAPLKFPPVNDYPQPTLAYNSDGTILMMLLRELDKAPTNPAQPKPLFYISLLDAATGRKLVEFSPGDSYRLKNVLSPDAKNIATTGSETLKVWDSATGKLRFELKGHLNEVRDFVFTPDGRVLVSGGDDGTLHFWETATGKLLYTELLSGEISDLKLSPDGRCLFVNFYGSHMKIFDLVLG